MCHKSPLWQLNYVPCSVGCFKGFGFWVQGFRVKSQGALQVSLKGCIGFLEGFPSVCPLRILLRHLLSFRSGLRTVSFKGCLWVTVKLLITGANHLRCSQGEGLRFLSSPTRGFSIRVLDFMSLLFWDLRIKRFYGIYRIPFVVL